MAEEVEVEACCEGMAEALDIGAIQIIETEPGIFVEAIADPVENAGIAINYCPFCGEPRPAQRIPMFRPTDMRH